MEAVVGLLVMLLRVYSGVETYCDGRQNGTQCYGALGGTVVLQLMENTSEIYRFQWTKNNTAIIHWRNNSFIENQIQNRSLFTPSDGTLRINNLSRSDGGEYKLEIYDSYGSFYTFPRYLQFSFQAPVSSVLLVSECLSQGEMRVSCSSEGGDSPQYSWTLDGHTLTDAELLSGNKETNNITLKQHVSGNLVCSVRNHVSHVFKEETISDCGFIFINCTSSDGTHISQWVFAANYTLCVEPTTTTVPTVGKETESIVSAPVSSVLLVSECLSQGEMRVSCSSEGGDSPQYSWTLDGHTLTDAELLSGNKETNNITLKQHVSGNLVCSVRNHVSHVSKEETISDCGFIFINCTSSNGTHISQWVFAANNTLCVEPTTNPTTTTVPTVGKETESIVSGKPITNISNKIMNQTASDSSLNLFKWINSCHSTIFFILPIVAGVLSALVLLSVIGLAVICTQTRKKNIKHKKEDNEVELTYADIRVIQRQERQLQQTAEVEVEYSQTVRPSGDDCVYAKVCRDR
ncbi:hypothetical protein Q5P01_009433 [Channa striata]|uniref:Ig-like domain-containing protein n=1 Tax=Channa striata TaxID=64152 RepID=A0AA88N4B1_CHASR|nr:hypothetical protein Q5P01_009433 [Channa striata]